MEMTDLSGKNRPLLLVTEEELIDIAKNKFSCKTCANSYYKNYVPKNKCPVVVIDMDYADKFGCIFWNYRQIDNE